MQKLGGYKSINRKVSILLKDATKLFAGFLSPPPHTHTHTHTHQIGYH